MIESRKYLFKCPKCGSVDVGQEYFEKFLDSESKDAVDEWFKLGSPGAVIKFKKQCPLCQPNGEHSGILLEMIPPDPKKN